MKTTLTIEEARRYVNDHFPFRGYMDGGVDSYDSIASTVKKYVQPGGTILDFGCGPCDKTAVVQLMGYRCSAYDDLDDWWHEHEDNRNKIVTFAGELGINLRRASEGYLPFDSESFDMVMANHVFEHFHSSPRETLNDLVALIKTGGHLLLTMPNAGNIRKRIALLFGSTNLPSFDAYYWLPGPWRGHVREYVRGDLTKLVSYLKLETINLSGCHHMLPVVPAFLRPLYSAATSVIKGWRDSWLLVARKPPGWTAQKTATREQYLEVMRRANPFLRALATKYPAVN